MTSPWNGSGASPPASGISVFNCFMERLRIVIFGPANSGKSTLVNRLAGQPVSLVSDIPGTTTDPVRKFIELPYGIGPAVLVDTAGIDDGGRLGTERKRLTEAEIDTADVAVVLLTDPVTAETAALLQALEKADVPTLRIPARSDGEPDALLRQIADIRPAGEQRFLTGDLVREGDTVLLVMPQDSEAPQGRLILPQVQVIRELLDRGCTPLCCTPASMQAALSALKALPALTITDASVFRNVNEVLPPEAPLTAFSVLLAAAKGDVRVFVEGARAIDRLTARSRVLIAEACSHVPDTEDIGRVKIPALLRRRAGDLAVDISAGDSFPQDLSPYDLVIHCGACVATRGVVRAHTRKALQSGVPVTNYGIALAYLQGMLDRIAIPGLPPRR